MRVVALSSRWYWMTGEREISSKLLVGCACKGVWQYGFELQVDAALILH